MGGDIRLRAQADEDQNKSLRAEELHTYLSWQVQYDVVNTSRPSDQKPQLVGEKARVMAAYGK